MDERLGVLTKTSQNTQEIQNGWEERKMMNINYNFGTN